tara:strand:- start:39 stop:746 length:708 start_codon:yes stop_codon:yes gene_type:complete
MNGLIKLTFALPLLLFSCSENTKTEQLQSRIDTLEIRLSESKTQLDKFTPILEEQQRIANEKAAEEKTFLDVIKVAMAKHGFQNYEFHMTSSLESICSTYDGIGGMSKKAIRLGWVERGKYLYESMFGDSYYEWKLTEKGRANLIEKESQYNKQGFLKETWHLSKGKKKLVGITKINYTNANQAKVTYSFEITSLTDYAFNDWFVGEIDEHTFNLRKKGDEWIITDSSPFASGWM